MVNLFLIKTVYSNYVKYFTKTAALIIKLVIKLRKKTNKISLPLLQYNEK